MSEFVTKDSGERQQFTSGMQRDTQKGKTLFHLVYDGPLFKRWAELLTRGAEKYSEGNWMKANGPEELNRFKASAARHFVQWFYGETDEDHAAAVFFNINGAEFVNGKIGVENLARINKVNKAHPEEVFFNPFERGEGIPITEAQAAQIVIDADAVHARKTQERFNFPLYDETYTTAVDATAPGITLDSLLKASSFLTPPQSKAIARNVLGVDYAKDDSYDRSVYVVGLPGKQFFVVPSDLQDEFEGVLLLSKDETLPVSDYSLDLLRFNSFPVVYTDNLGASPLDSKPAFNGVTIKFRFDIPDEPTPFIDLIRRRVFDAQLALAEQYLFERPDFAGSCSGDEPFNFFQRLLIKLQDLYQDVKSLVAKKLYDAAVGLDPEVTYEDVEA